MHDRKFVADLIVRICIEAGVRQLDVEVAEDAVSARVAMTETHFDLAIIDLTIPFIKGVGDATYAITDQLLTEISLTENMYVPGDIIGITQDAEALKLVENAIPSKVMTIIEQNGDEPAWKLRLDEKLRYIQRSLSHRARSINAQHDYDLLVFCALDKELKPYKDYFDFSPLPHADRCYSFGFTCAAGEERRGIAYSVGGSGEARAASHAQSLISLFRPKLAIMSGICGGVPIKTKLGDLVFAESAVDWDYGKWEVDEDGRSKFVPRPDPQSIRGSTVHGLVRDLIDQELLSNAALVEELQKETKGEITFFTCHNAPFGSGSSVIASDDILSQVRGLNDAIRGVDMESFGFYHAALNTHVVPPAVLCVKAVSDFSNGQKDDSKHDACCFASYRAARVIFEDLWEFR